MDTFPNQTESQTYLNWRAELDTWQTRWQQRRRAQDANDEKDSRFLLSHSLKIAGSEFNEWRERATGASRMTAASTLESAPFIHSPQAGLALTSSWRQRERDIWRTCTGDTPISSSVQTMGSWSEAVEQNRHVARTARRQREDREGLLARSAKLAQLQCNAEASAKNARELRSELEKQRLEAISARKADP